MLPVATVALVAHLEYLQLAVVVVAPMVALLTLLVEQVDLAAALVIRLAALAQGLPARVITVDQVTVTKVVAEVVQVLLVAMPALK